MITASSARAFAELIESPIELERVILAIATEALAIGDNIEHAPVWRQWWYSAGNKLAPLATELQQQRMDAR